MLTLRITQTHQGQTTTRTVAGVAANATTELATYDGKNLRELGYITRVTGTEGIAQMTATKYAYNGQVCEEMKVTYELG
jgi:hypothetical protein